MVQTSMGKKATTTHVGKKTIFFKMGPTDYFEVVMVPFPPPLGVRNKKKRLGLEWFFLVVDFEHGEWDGFQILNLSFSITLKKFSFK